MTTWKTLAFASGLSLLLGGCPQNQNLPAGETTDANTTATGDVTNQDSSGGAGASALTGRLTPGQAAKVRMRTQAAEFPYTVVAQSNETGTIYRDETDANGDFTIDLPAEEDGHAFVVTILGPDGHAVGPVVFDTSGSNGVTGVKPDGDTSLGTVDLPDDPATAPILTGTDVGTALAGLLDPNVSARLNEHGVPVGLESVGKGTGAVNASGTGNGQADADRDGLIDLFDADNDGNGVVDEFEQHSTDSGAPVGVDFRPYTTVYCAAEAAVVMYSGTPTQVRDTRIQNNNIVFFLNSTGTHQIAAARILEAPAPAYLEQIQIPAAHDGGTQNMVLWSTTGYALDPEPGSSGFWICVRPGTDVLAGDIFTAEVTFQDGTVEQYSKMFNYTFVNIPKLMQYGTAGNLQAFDVTNTVINGRPEQPIPFDGAQDLVLVVQPPVDDTGAFVTGMKYSFTIFYERYDGPGQNMQYHDINYSATLPSPPDSFFDGQYDVQDSTLTLAADNTYTFTLPHEIFVDTVTFNDGTQGAVNRYKIDINAQHVAAKASVMLSFAKQ